MQKIQRDFDKNNLKELTLEEAMERFLNIFATYSMSYGSYYVVRAGAAVSNQTDLPMLGGDQHLLSEHDEEN